ncbi:MAG: alpha-2-macroglobulin family protein, partial [Chloroflexota bacterium]
RDNRYRNTVQAWVQVTQIGLDAFADQSEMIVWASDLKNGTPLGSLVIADLEGRQLASTGGDGTARFDLPDRGIVALVASSGDDRAMLPQSNFIWDDGSWSPRPVTDELRWYVFDDRSMYRPGEEVHVKGWLRRVGGGKAGDVGLVGADLSSVQWQVIGAQGNELVSGRSEANALGGFDLAFSIPEQSNLGYAQIRLQALGNLSGLSGQDYYHQFQIQEFRRPEFEVTARNETPGPYISGGQATVAAKASYYAGGPLPNAEVTWQVSTSPSAYSPPNWPDFVFGKWTPWWYGYDVLDFYGPMGPEGDAYQVETFSGLTDAVGEHYLQLDFEHSGEPQPHSIMAEATVMDVNRQAWSASTSLLVHPSELYVGLRSARTFVERGQPLDIDLIVTDLDGNAVSGRAIAVRAARLAWQYGQSGWEEQEVDIQECELLSAAEPVSCSFTTEVGGRYRITATIEDSAGRPNMSQFVRWVSGGQQPPAREVEQELVTLIPDKESYQPGDVAQILVQSPFGPAEGLLTVSRGGLLTSERFTMADGSYTLQIPIRDENIPNLNVQVDLAGSAPRSNDQGEVLEDAPPRPAYASGQLNLSIPALSRTLALEIAPQEAALEPGGETVVDVSVVDAAGRPVSGAEVALVVVDEAVLALSNYQLMDPISAFYYQRPSMLSSVYGRASIVLANPELLSEQARSANLAAQATVTSDMVVEEAEMAFALEAPAEAPMAAGAAVDTAQEGPAIRVRINFDPLATFAPAVRTGADGRAQVPVTLPDNLTRYRIMAVAVDDDKSFGSAESNLVARLPLMVRPSAPRFLNFGDSLEVPVVLQNQTDQEMAVDVVVETANLDLLAEQGRRVTVPANDRVEVRFPAATVMPGTARLQFAAVSGNYADAATAELPVYTPATTEAFATYGVVDQGSVVQPVLAPSAVFPQFGGLEITTSSTALQALTDAVLYLVSYPYDSSSQLASRILAVAALRDVLTAFKAEGLPTPEEMETAVQGDIEMLQGLQNYDGGFPYWARGKDSIPYLSVHVAHALQQAEAKGFDVPPEMQQMVLDYLRYIEDYYPDYYGKKTRQTISAYALYVRYLMGDVDRDKARGLLDEAGLENLSLEAVAWLWMVLDGDPASSADVEAIRRHIGNRAVETAGAANFTTDYGDDAYLLLHSNRRTDAIILDALIAGDPESDLIPKVVNGLLAHRTQGRWYNTQENVFILLALDRYFNTFEAQEP